MIVCSVHGKCFNIGRRRAINLTQASNLEYKSHQHQCSVAAVKLEGGVFKNGLDIDEFIRAVRLTSLSVSAGLQCQSAPIGVQQRPIISSKK